ncbi:HAMP domain-containing sensor histidine kinase [Paenibacillus flagellatus]|uniref:histidine kinase n=1 Tax=Paenibacillus flagellatus TaxID=2211139 RepID=A0A2V5JXK6_9BACL|nr:HAMP domain-containing sensor histidine kinase [Paenibacillus flagellatus]PYI51518.1 hypothetical protein DLM86_24150 [Paenibacillus flagellatus]
MKSRTKLWLVMLIGAASSIVLFFTISMVTGKAWNKGYDLNSLNAVSQGTLTSIERQNAFSGTRLRAILDEAHARHPELRLEWLAADGSTLYDTSGQSHTYDFRQLAERFVHMPNNLWSEDGVVTLVDTAEHGGQSYYLLVSLSSEAMKPGQIYFYLRTYQTLMAFALPFLVAALLPYGISLWFFSSSDRRIRRLNTALNRVGIRSDAVLLEDGSRDEIGQLTRHYNSMVERIRSQAAQIGQFENRRRLLLSNLSHDLRTPLTMILGYAETIRTGGYKDENELQTGAKIILQRSRYMDKLLDQLLDIARHEDHVPELRPARHNLSELLRKIVADYLLVLDGKPFEVAADIPDDDIEVVFDAPLIERALRNLLDNAVRYGGDGQFLGVGLEETADEVRLTVRDRGKGVAVEDRERIFERFYRADGGRKGEGLGIGLSIVKEIAELHRGTVRLLAPAEDGGAETVFELRLPKTPVSLKA